MRRWALAGLAVTAIVAAGCGSSSSSPNASSTSAPATASVQARNANGCTPAPAHHDSVQQFSHEPALTIARTTYTGRFVTNCGTITVALDGKKAPHTVNSFAFLAGKKFFDDTPCHRLVTQGIFVLQCGDPTGTGRGGPGYTIPDENLSGATYPAGTVAMANTGAPHTGGSQFFFVYQDTQLPPDYTPFGTITSGLDVLKRIAAAGADSATGDGAPKQPVSIETFTVTKGAPTG